jgi:hypothetical protein
MNATVTKHRVKLNWTASPSDNVVGYYVYSGTASGGPYRKRNGKKPAPHLQYTTQALKPGSYYFVCTAVNSQGEESVYSNEAEATVQ